MHRLTSTIPRFHGPRLPVRRDPIRAPLLARQSRTACGRLRSICLRSRRCATLRGWSQSLALPATLLSPIIAGLLFDATGEYRTFFLVASVVSASGLLWLLLIRRPVWNELAPRENAR